uniref:SFRICE_010723 n=1 Tax=Spodoptera frugiperda TaxID=7108 RepID=A0A2H1V5K1_SPOFR
MMYLLLELTEYHYTFDDEVDNGSIPIITLEVMSDSSIPDPIIANYVDGAAPGGQFDDALNKDTGVHFLTEQMQKLEPKYEGNKEEGKEVKGRHDLLEYMLRTDGSVICKMCGEILQSRTHWYRHKYKRHAAQPPNPAPLFQCEQCLVYFKSRKGYIGHIASRHSELLSDSSPVLTNTQAIQATESSLQEIKEEADPESMIPKTSVPNYQTSVVKHTAKATEPKKTYRSREQLVNQADWEEKRSREEKLVADIIDRVRRECEAHPTPQASTRRPYARRTTPVIHTLRQTNALT